MELIIPKDRLLTINDLRQVQLIRDNQIVGINDITSPELHMSLVDKLLSTLNYKEFRDHPHKYIAKFQKTFAHYDDSSIYKRLLFALNRVMQSNRIKFIDSLAYDIDLKHCNKTCDNDASVQSCLLAMINNTDLTQFPKKIQRKASTLYASWRTELATPYTV